ncbi:MAG: hypothetical protein K2M07_04650 [Muribaculaceae bacterium]|nr:hypothetical protein [Muribaculaceae bacterium]
MRKLTAIIAAALTVAVCSCSGDNDRAVTPEEDIYADYFAPFGLPTVYDAHFDSMPPGGRKLRVRNVGVLGRVFNDSNYKHLAAAREIGIAPIHDHSDLWKLGRPLVRIRSNRYYFVDELTHSLPFLVPEAADLLEDISRNWMDTMQARGGGHYRLKVTSVLRTPATVKKLRRRNRNAVDTSAHCFGTTFDISYAKFICDSVNMPRTQEDMKNLLAEILYDLREQGRCYVKYERKQGCFHITTRHPSEK